MANKKVVIELSEMELWNCYICLHNLTTKPKKNFYDKKTKAEMVAIRDRLYKLGKEVYKWV